MNLADKMVYSLTDNYGFEYGKTYKVISDDEREIVMENGHRFFKDTFHLTFADNYTKLFYHIKNRVDRMREENHRLCAENVKLDYQISLNKKKFLDNTNLIAKLVKIK